MFCEGRGERKRHRERERERAINGEKSVIDGRSARLLHFIVCVRVCEGVCVCVCVCVCVFVCASGGVQLI